MLGIQANICFERRRLMGALGEKKKIIIIIETYETIIHFQSKQTNPAQSPMYVCYERQLLNPFNTNIS